MTSEEQAKSRKELGELFREARERLKLTQSQVAEKADVHVNFYARVERGEENPSFEKLQSIMKVLGINSLNLF